MSPQDRGSPGSFRQLEAAELYCPRCRRSQPVRKRLLLVLPQGEEYEYRCSRCGEALGTKLEGGPKVLP